VKRSEERGTRNITLALPAELLRKVKVLAAERNTSVSSLLIETLRDLIGRETAYDRARRRALASLAHPRHLGTGGHATWTRDELHERR
jgi:predicted transcriptional regulator